MGLDMTQSEARLGEAPGRRGEVRGGSGRALLDRQREGKEGMWEIGWSVGEGLGESMGWVWTFRKRGCNRKFQF